MEHVPISETSEGYLLDPSQELAEDWYSLDRLELDHLDQRSLSSLARYMATMETGSG